MKNFVALWNNKYILDYWFRRKYNIRFNSSQHRGSNLVDIYFEFIEEKMFQDAKNKQALELKLQERKKEHGWLTEQETEMEEDILKDLDLSIFDDGDS